MTHTYKKFTHTHTQIINLISFDCGIVQIKS